MHIKEVQYDDILSNVLIKSKAYLEQGIKIDHKLNYRKRYDNPKELEISYVDALANLQEINQLFRKRINERNQHYNFFLDNSEDPSIQNPIEVELFVKYLEFFKRGNIFAYTLQNTWTKGSVMSVVKIYNDRIFVDVSYRGKVGLMKLEELKIILSENELSEQ